MTRPETVEALAKVLAAGFYEHSGASTYDATCGICVREREYVRHLAAALLDAIDAGQVPGLATSEAVERAKREAMREAAEAVLTEFDPPIEACVWAAEWLRDRAEAGETP